MGPELQRQVLCHSWNETFCGGLQKVLLSLKVDLELWSFFMCIREMKCVHVGSEHQLCALGSEH